MEESYLQFLRYCLDESRALPESAKGIDWIRMMAWAESQAIVGIIYSGIQQAGKAIGIPFEALMEWVGYANRIEGQNQLTTMVCGELKKEFENSGFKTCILKGQANYGYYPPSMNNLRMCGDVDTWVVPKDDPLCHPVKRVLEYLEHNMPVRSLCYLHAEVHPKREIPVEVHFHPSFMNEPRHNRRFLRHFKNFDQCVCSKDINGETLPVLTWEYDVIFQLCHIYRHLIDEGVGLRQVIDYYFLLMNSEKLIANDWSQLLRYLGLYKFAGALMWVLHERLGLGEDYLITSPNEKGGRFLWDEIMTAGNFGQSDPRMSQLEVEKGKTSYQVKRAWRRMKRNSRFVMSYPSEVIWEPIARYEHLCWRKFKFWKL